MISGNNKPEENCVKTCGFLRSYFLQVSHSLSAIAGLLCRRAVTSIGTNRRKTGEKMERDDGYSTGTQPSYPQYRRVVVDGSGRMSAGEEGVALQPMQILFSSRQQPEADSPRTKVITMMNLNDWLQRVSANK